MALPEDQCMTLEERKAKETHLEELYAKHIILGDTPQQVTPWYESTEYKAQEAQQQTREVGRKAEYTRTINEIRAMLTPNLTPPTHEAHQPTSQTNTTLTSTPQTPTLKSEAPPQPTAPVTTASTGSPSASTT